MTTTRQAFYKYIHTSNTLQVFVGGKPLSAPATNVGVVNAVLAAIHDPKTTDEDIIALMDVKKAAVTVLGKLPGAHVRHEDGEDVLYVDDIKVPKVLTEKVLDIIAQGGDVDPWYLCLEKCRQNPWRDAIEMFCQLMDRWGTPITTEGDLLFVKSVRSDYYDRRTGTIRYTIGEVIADQKLIDNPKLTDSSRAACSNGLHFGPWKGAKAYYDRNNGRYLLVKLVALVVMLALANANRQRLSRRADDTGDPHEIGTLRRTVLGEFAIGLAIIAITAALVVSPPATSEGAGASDLPVVNYTM